MRRNLPIKRTEKQNLIISAVFDYFGKGMAKQGIPAAKAIALFLMNRKKGIKLLEEQKLDMLTIKSNLRDDIYIAALLSERPYSHLMPHSTIVIGSNRVKDEQ